MLKNFILNMKKFFVPALSLLLAVAGLAFVACNKDNDHDHSNTATINILSPVEGQVVAAGATLIISAEASAPEELHGWEIILRNKATGVQIDNFDEHDHGTSFQVEQDWVANVPPGTEVELEFIVVVDHEDNTNSKKVNFQVQ